MKRQSVLARPMNRRAFAVAASTVSLAALAPRAFAQGTPTASPAATPASGTRTIQTVNGPVDVPVNPSRVICIDSYSIADLIDVGLVPIAIPEVDLDSYISVYRDQLADVPTVGNFQEIDVEKIAVLKPEVILTINAPWATEVYDQLSQIAPTVMFDYAVPDAWQVLADQFTDAVGRSSQLDTLKQDYATRTSEVKSANSETLAATTWAIANGWGAADNQWTLYFPDSAPGKVLTDCGGRLVEAATGKTGTSEPVSYERLSLLRDADVILTYGTRDGTPSPESQAMIDQPLFQALTAAREDHVYAITNIVPGSYGDALNFIGKIEDIIKELAS